MKYIFVDVGVNTIVRVNAPTLDDAWKKYIDHRIYKLQHAEGEPYHTRDYNYIREDLERSVFVASEDMEVTEIE